MDWAAAALEKSSNQPVLPHAIIVLNASKNDIDPALWDVDTSTSRLFESLSRTVFQNDTFKKYAQFWRERHRSIETLEQLLRSYYRNVNVVRIPTSGRPNLIQTQVETLYACIASACSDARERKAELRMLLDADDLQPYLQYAFDHFAYYIDSPFDFVQASLTNSPIPLDFGGNILKLAINFMEQWKNAADIQIIFTELSYMVRTFRSRSFVLSIALSRDTCFESKRIVLLSRLILQLDRLSRISNADSNTCVGCVVYHVGVC